MIPLKAQRRVILTGGSGTLGRNFLELVAHDESMDMLCLLREESRTPTDLPRCRFARIDFNDQRKINEIVNDFRPTSFVHAAAAGMNFAKPEWFDLIRFNVGVSMNFCQSVARIPNCHFIFISSGLAYRDQGIPLTESAPLDTLHPYGASKAAADILMRAAAAEFGVPMTVLRPFSFTGLWDDGTRLFSTLLRAAIDGQPMKLSPGEQKRDHCSARDIAEGIRATLLAGPPKAGKVNVYNLGSGSMLPLRGLLEGIVNELELRVDLQFGARSYAPFEPMCLVADTTAAARELAWHPRHNLAHAVWQLAHESFPTLKLREPQEVIRDEFRTLDHSARL